MHWTLEIIVQIKEMSHSSSLAGYVCWNGFDDGFWRQLFLGEGNGNPLQNSSLENPMDRGACRATSLRVTKSQTRLSNWNELNWTDWYKQSYTRRESETAYRKDLCSHFVFLHENTKLYKNMFISFVYIVLIYLKVDFSPRECCIK